MQAKSFKTLKNKKEKTAGERDEAQKAFDKAKADRVTAQRKCHCGVKTWYYGAADEADKDLKDTHSAALTKVNS